MPTVKRAERIKIEPELKANTVALYAAQKMRVSLDPSVPAVKLESSLGAACKKVIDGAYALQTAHGLFLDSTSDALRAILREVLNAAIRTQDKPFLRDFTLLSLDDSVDAG